MAFRYFPMGGCNYSAPDFSDESDEGFETMEEAVSEWKRRRQDWTGRFPCWGDGQDNADSGHESIVILANETEIREAWTFEEAVPKDEQFHYYDD